MVERLFWFATLFINAKFTVFLWLWRVGRAFEYVDKDYGKRLWCSLAKRPSFRLMAVCFLYACILSLILMQGGVVLLKVSVMIALSLLTLKFVQPLRGPSWELWGLWLWQAMGWYLVFPHPSRTYKQALSLVVLWLACQTSLTRGFWIRWVLCLFLCWCFDAKLTGIAGFITIASFLAARLLPFRLWFGGLVACAAVFLSVPLWWKELFSDPRVWKTLYLRGLLWDATWKNLNFWGHGLGSASSMLRIIFSQEPPCHPHNYVLEIIYELGVPGIVMVLGTLALALWWIYKHRSCHWGTFLLCCIVLSSGSYDWHHTWWISSILMIIGHGYAQFPHRDPQCVYGQKENFMFRFWHSFHKSASNCKQSMEKH